MRKSYELYPDYYAEIKEIEKNGITAGLLSRIIKKHRGNGRYNRKLYKRYQCLDNAVDIFNRRPRFPEDENALNNKINNDFFSEIVEFKVGYFAGKPIGYSYSQAPESGEATGGDKAVKEASKALTDFVTRSSMYNADMELTKFASICGYGGRLFYIDTEGKERVIILPPYETIVLSDTDVTEPKYAVRYYPVEDIDGRKTWIAEYYDEAYVYYYTGGLSELKFEKQEPHLFDGCPLQIVPNNLEMTGDAEKVLNLIDAYDRVTSDCSNDIESFANAYMILKNANLSDEDIEKAQKSGIINIVSGGAEAEISFLTKNINDTFLCGHLDRIEKNIYRFSKTPNLNDESFGNASGVALKFKLTGLETKCGIFQAKLSRAGVYMFKLLARSFEKRQIKFDPLQCIMDFKRNFPIDVLSEAQAAQALIAAGVPKEVAYGIAVSSIDDVDYVMQLIDDEINGIGSLNETEE